MPDITSRYTDAELAVLQQDASRRGASLEQHQHDITLFVSAVDNANNPAPPPPPPPPTDKKRFAKRLGVQQPYPTIKTMLDAIADTPNHHAKLYRLEGQVPVGGNWNLSYFKGLFDAIRAQGGAALVQITYTPRDCWEPGWVASWGDEVASYPRSAANQDRWVGYARKLIEWGKANYPTEFAAVEVCNEPNGFEFGAASGKYPVDPTAYVALLKRFYAMAAATWPELIVVTGGTAPAPTDGKQIGPNDWYSRLKTGGAQPGTHFDAIGCHLYDGTNGNYSQNADKIAGYWSGVQLWATEQGVGGDNPTWVASNIDAWRAKGYAGPWFEFTCFDRTSAAAGFDGYGLSRYDGTRKRSFAEFAKRAP